MDTYKAILNRRSIRNFKNKKIDLKLLKRMVSAARLAPSAANMQPLEFFIVTEETLSDEVFKHLKWAGYIAPKGNPNPGQEPVAYIVVLINKRKVSRPVLKRDETAIRYSFKADLRDVGAACQNILLLAQSYRIASCWLGAINKPGIRKALHLPKHLEVDSVIALGYPNMRSKTVTSIKSIQYYLDKQGTFCVPKRSPDDVMHINKIKDSKK